VIARAASTSGYQNPVSGDTPDPAGLNNNGSGSDYYLYATGNDFPIQHSSDLVHWTYLGTALTQPPSWVVQSGDWNPWSPSVLQANRPCPATQSPSCYYMYYVGLSAQFGIHCVAVATSPTPAGPFTDRGPLSNGALDSSGRPIGCGDDTGYGNIDPAPFVDADGSAYLYVSTDYACSPGSSSCTAASSTLQPTISVLPLAPDLLSVPVSGQRKALFSGQPNSWEQAPWAPVVEGPWMEKHNRTYYLFYSGGAWTGNYGIGDATMRSPLGKGLQKDPKNPILYGTATVFSPGGGSTIIGPRGGDWMLYHARLGSYTAPRQLFIDPMVWRRDGSVTVSGPTTTPQSPGP
jgi:beta-xylosidase